MNRRAARRLCWWFLVVVIGLGLVFNLAVHRKFTGDDLVVLPLFGYAVVGAIVALRRPENPIGWIFLTIGMLTSLAAFSGAGADRAFHSGPPIPWWGVLSAWYNSWFWYPLFMLATTFTFLLFPSGLPSRRWRPIFWLAVATTVLASALSAVAPRIEIGVDLTSGDSVMIVNPMSPSFASEVGNADESWWVSGPLILGVFCGFAAIVSVALRTWRARGLERQQMRLFAFAIALVPLQILLSAIPGFSNSWLGNVSYGLALGCIPLACGVAILRYHLFDINRIIGRTTAYGLVTGALLAVYFAVVTAVTQLLPESGDLAVAAATLAAAAVFRPVLGWAQRLVNRRFNREQYDAERAVEQFAARLRDEVDPEAVAMQLLDVVRQTVQPAAVGVVMVGGPT